MCGVPTFQRLLTLRSFCLRDSGAVAPSAASAIEYDRCSLPQGLTDYIPKPNGLIRIAKELILNKLQCPLVYSFFKSGVFEI